MQAFFRSFSKLFLPFRRHKLHLACDNVVPLLFLSVALLLYFRLCSVFKVQVLPHKAAKFEF